MTRRRNPRNPFRKRLRFGVVLLEVVIALTIFGAAALTAVALVQQSTDTVEHIQIADDEIQRASAFLDAVALWPRQDLDRRLGDRPQGKWILHIDHPDPVLYRIGLYDSTRTALLLETALFRPEVRDANP